MQIGDLDKLSSSLVGI